MIDVAPTSVQAENINWLYVAWGLIEKWFLMKEFLQARAKWLKRAAKIESRFDFKHFCLVSAGNLSAKF